VDLDTTEKSISVIVGVIVIGSTVYGVFRERVNRSVRRWFAQRHRQQGKQCPRCGALHARRAVQCGRCKFRFVRRRSRGGRA
jgi:ribosomal protein L40E